MVLVLSAHVFWESYTSNFKNSYVIHTISKNSVIYVLVLWNPVENGENSLFAPNIT
jgi:hypothetical protein